MSLVVQGTAGTITVPDPVLLQIAAHAAESIDGVRVRRRRAIDVEARRLRLELAAGRGDPLTVVGVGVQEAVAAAMKAMCNLELTIDVAIEELV